MTTTQDIRKISIVVSIYNEEKTLRQIITACLDVDLGQLERELILVNDCSTDKTPLLIKEYEGHENIRIVNHEVNNRFGFEPEVTVRIAKTKCVVYEVGISYSGRTYAEGKHIGWKDGFDALPVTKLAARGSGLQPIVRVL